MSWPLDGARDEGPLREGETFARRYVVGERLGKGGSASVYRAYDEVLEETCALKVIHKEGGLREDQLQRGKTEARILMRRLRHPNIVQVTDANLERGMFYMAMELLPGRTLRDALDEHRWLSIVEALRYFAKVALAIHAAHVAQIVHRDLKPENLFVLPGNEPKILDFGVAKIREPGGWQTLPDVVVGTVKYLSPEQILGLAATAQSDIHAIGEMLFECIVGQQWCWLDQRSFSSALELAKYKLDHQPPRLDELGLKVPSYVADLVQRALLRRPEQRYPTALAFAEEMLARADVYEEELARAGRAPLYRELWHVPKVDTAPTAAQTMVFSDGTVAAHVPDRTIEDAGPRFALSTDTTQSETPAARLGKSAPTKTLEPSVVVASSPPTPAPPVDAGSPPDDTPYGFGPAPVRPTGTKRWSQRFSRLRGRFMEWARTRPWSWSVVLSGSCFGLAVSFLVIVFVLDPASSDDPAVVEAPSAQSVRAAESSSLPGEPERDASERAAPARALDEPRTGDSSAPTEAVEAAITPEEPRPAGGEGTPEVRATLQASTSAQATARGKATPAQAAAPLQGTAPSQAPPQVPPEGTAHPRASSAPRAVVPPSEKATRASAPAPKSASAPTSAAQRRSKRPSQARDQQREKDDERPWLRRRPRELPE